MSLKCDPICMISWIYSGHHRSYFFMLLIAYAGFRLGTVYALNILQCLTTRFANQKQMQNQAFPSAASTNSNMISVSLNYWQIRLYYPLKSFVFCQVIALNSSLAAEGELYLDDGKSYDFEQGAYIHRRFVFSNGKLTSSSLRPSNLSKEFPSNCVIERIILLGLPAGAKKAVIEPGNQQADIEPGPLVLRTGASPVALVVRKPNLRVSDDWALRIL